MDRFGCTTPFDSNKENICTEKEKSIEAWKFYKKMTVSPIKNCSYPCKFLRVLVTPAKVRNPQNEKKQGWIKMQFNKFIRVTNAEYSYTELELLAEFGGYVGLFLGISVFHFSDLFDKILDWCLPLY